MRINRFLASAGFGSRRSCEKLVQDGKVAINGRYIDSLATSVEDGDDVRVSGKQVRPPATKTVVALYKPKGFVSTRSDERARQTIYHLLPHHFARLGHVGRLDKDSEGLLLLTDDGMLAQQLGHPTRKVEKEYEVLLDGPVEPEMIDKMLRGFQIPGGRARMDSIRRIAPNHVRVVLTQGIKRQIRLMFYRLGREVVRLVRTRIGPVSLDNLKPGEWRTLPPRDLAALAKPTAPPSRPAPRKPRPPQP